MDSLKEKLVNIAREYILRAHTTLCLLIILAAAQIGVINLDELRDNILLAYRSLFPSSGFIHETYWLNIVLWTSIVAFLLCFAWRRYCQNTHKLPVYAEIDVIEKTDQMMYFIVNTWLLGIIAGLKFDIWGTFLLFWGELIIVAIAEALISQKR